MESGNTSFAMVDDVLTSNGHMPLMSEEEYYTESSMERSYCSAVEERSTELEVIWRGKSVVRKASGEPVAHNTQHRRLLRPIAGAPQTVAHPIVGVRRRQLARNL